MDDRLKPLREIAPKGYPRRWLESMDRALALKPRNRDQRVPDGEQRVPDRFQSVAEWQQALGGAGLSAETRGAKPARWGLMLVILVALAGGGYGLIQVMAGSGQQDTQAQLDHLREEHQAEAARQAQQLDTERQARQQAEAEAERLRKEKAEAEQQAQPHKEKTEALAGAMVQITGGCFQMGSPESETGRDGDEKQHRVCVKDFAIGQYEVTVGEFKRFVSASGYKTDAEKNSDGEEGCHISYGEGSEWEYGYRAGYSWKNPNFKQGDDHPVVCVSWNDARAYTKWLSDQTGQSYRLPTEAEWEYAARAGTTTARYWGDDPDVACRYANVADQTAKQIFPDWMIHNCTDGYPYTAPVNSFQANRWGLNNLLGNVWEWTCSVYDGEYGGADQKCTNDDGGDDQVMRGGAWNRLPAKVPSAYRNGYSPANRFYSAGFRLARSL